MTVTGYLAALLETEIIETTVAYLLGYRKGREIAAVLLVNLVTHPLLHYYALLHEYFDLLPMSMTVLFFLEIGIVFGEWGLLSFALKEKSRGSLFILSATMNTCSYLAGLGIR
ncbi:MAG TPA: hypothetical protein VG733_08205 [Chthoniobacteraceae bacterium]|nr:hypothetical protein [Chthoniobacteraceae bacterium]